MVKLWLVAALTSFAASSAQAEIISVQFSLDGLATHAIFSQNDQNLSPDDPNAVVQVQGSFEIDTVRLYSEHVFTDDRPGYMRILEPGSFSGIVAGHAVSYLAIQIAYDPRQLLYEGLTFCGTTSAEYTQMCGADGATNTAVFDWAQNLSGANFTVLPNNNGGMSGIYGGTAPADGNFSFSMGRNFVFGDGAAVPEPCTWAFMLTGFGIVGAALRRRLSQAPFVGDRLPGRRKLRCPSASSGPPCAVSSCGSF